MHVRHVKGGLLAFAFAASLATTGTASAQSAEAKQVLDTVAIFGPGRVDKADFLNGDTDPGVTVGAGETVRACQLTAGSGLYCLVRKSDGILYVVNWSNPANSTSAKTLFACAGIADLDWKSADVCTGLTVDLGGDIWIAGKNKGKTHNLVKVVKGKPDNSWTQVGSTGYYWKNWATGRPLLIDITSVDGEEAANFALGEGVIGLQERKIVVFVPAAEPPDPSKSAIEIASGRTGWGLEPKEQLQGVTFEAVDGPDDMVYVTTSKGRILAKNLSDSLVPYAARLVPGSLSAPTADCTVSSPQFGIRRSGKSGLVYVTNYDCKVLYAFNPSSDWSTAETIDGLNEPPEGPTVAPGIGVNLADPNCAGSSGCEPVAGFKMSFVDLSSEESGLTLFQVKGIPDCRYVPQTCRTLLGNPGLDLRAAGIIVVRSGVGEPQASNPAVQYLNVTPLLPVEITSLYESSGGLPDLLISPQYHAQPRSAALVDDDSAPDDYLFEAFFGKAEDNLLFNGTFDTIFKVGTLAGRENGCLDSNTTPNKAGEVAGIPEDLLHWDIVTRVSEKYASTPSGPAHIDTLVNTDCGSAKGSFGGWSLVSYNLEPTRDTYVAELGRVVANNDAVFARLLQHLYGELGVVTKELACTTYDVPTIKDGSGVLVSNPNAPISPGICATLRDTWDNSWDKLDKCLKATYQPKTSYGDQNCQSFLSQFKNYNDALAVAGPFGLDPANRKGELASRAKVIDYVYHERFVPSIPEGGFCVESDTCK